MLLSTIIASIGLVAPPIQGVPTTFMVHGVRRTAIVYAPQRPGSAPPLLIAFHGHGGNGLGFSRNTRFPADWPEAIEVFPDGLPSVTKRDPQGKKPGWQDTAGQAGDRDVALFEEIVAKMKAKYHVDSDRVYVAGFSNGARFTYLLWSMRSKQIRAIAASAGNSMPDLGPNLDSKPAVVIHGKNDALCTEPMGVADFKAILEANKAIGTFNPWPNGTVMKLHGSQPGGAATLVISHQGPHEWPAFATPPVVKFFMSH